MRRTHSETKAGCDENLITKKGIDYETCKYTAQALLHSNTLQTFAAVEHARLQKKEMQRHCSSN